MDLALALKEPVLPQATLVVFLLPIKVVSQLGMPCEVFLLLLDLASLGQRKGLHWAGMGCIEDGLKTLYR